MTAFYLKYRPQSLGDLVGQDQVKATLLGAFSQNKLSHAYLFVGPRGTGKTSTARILAKMVNCEKHTSVVSRQSSDNSNDLKAESEAILKTDSYIPCNDCATCLSITDGSNLDLIEIDAASNRGIEDIRALREKIKLSPSGSKKKVYIIDEVHMLTSEAFNALLKTLEEPPAHVLFILATTDATKLPQTILSRVQRLDFNLATKDELLKALQKIITQEKIDIEEEGLKLIIKKSEGSFRDGVKFLDQISSQEGKITLESVQKSLNYSNSEFILELISSLAKKDTTRVLVLITKQVDEGADIKELTSSLMDSLRSLVFIKNGLGENSQELINLSENFNNQELVKILDLLQKALEKLKFASIPSLPLELALIEACSLGGQDIIKVESQQVEQSVPIISETVVISSSDDMQKLKEKWTFVLETIRPFNFSLEALLRSIQITECTQAAVVLEVPYSFHQRILEAPKNRDLLESILSDILGRNIRISTILGARTQRKEDIANIEVAADDEIIRAAAEIFNSDTIN